MDGNANITIKGSSRDANDAKREILDLISSNANRSDGNSRSYDSRNSDQSRNSYGRDSRHSDQSRSSRGNDFRDSSQSRNSHGGYGSQSNEHKDTLEIYPDKVGTVIGRRGATIQELQDKFKVRINVDKTTNYNGKSSVVVTGNRDDVNRAIDDIKELVGESKTNDNQQSQNDQQPMEYEMIDWQAAARESVNMIGIFSLQHFVIQNQYSLELIRLQEEENRRRWAALPPLQKNFYKEHPDVANFSAEKVAEIHQQNNNITVSRLILDEKADPNKTYDPIPNPVETFDQCFADYPDLMGKLTFKIHTFFVE